MMRLNGARGAACLLATLAITGCAVGPDYQRPELALQDEFSASLASTTAETALESAWWESLGDPVLDEVVRQAALGSFTIAEAEARLRGEEDQRRVEHELAVRFEAEEETRTRSEEDARRALAEADIRRLMDDEDRQRASEERRRRAADEDLERLRQLVLEQTGSIETTRTTLTRRAEVRESEERAMREREEARRENAQREIERVEADVRAAAEAEASRRAAFDARVANAATACLHAWHDRTATLKRARALVRDACERWRIDRSRDAFGTWREAAARGAEVWRAVAAAADARTLAAALERWTIHVNAVWETYEPVRRKLSAWKDGAMLGVLFDRWVAAVGRAGSEYAGLSDEGRRHPA